MNDSPLPTVVVVVVVVLVLVLGPVPVHLRVPVANLPNCTANNDMASKSNAASMRWSALRSPVNGFSHAAVATTAVAEVELEVEVEEAAHSAKRSDRGMTRG